MISLMSWQAEPLVIQTAIDYALRKYGTVKSVRVKKGVKLECEYPVIEDKYIAYPTIVYVEVEYADS